MKYALILAAMLLASPVYATSRTPGGDPDSPALVTQTGVHHVSYDVRAPQAQSVAIPARQVRATPEMGWPDYWSTLMLAYKAWLKEVLDLSWSSNI